jgi:hypothetical protein
MEDKTELVSNIFLRYLLILFGTIFLCLGIIGIVLPVLPTTPFLLLTAACYARSSKRFHSWLLNNKWFGQYISNYQKGEGIPLKVKILAIFFLWITILIASYFFIESYLIELLLFVIATIVSIHIILIKTYCPNILK